MSLPGPVLEVRGSSAQTPEELEAALDAGGRLVFYEYCVSLVLVTLRRPSALYLLRADELGVVRGLPYALLSLLLGWWGIPWGIVYTPLAIITNLSGGRDVTDDWRTLWAGRLTPGAAEGCDA